MPTVYESSYTGQHNDYYENRISELETQNNDYSTRIQTLETQNSDYLTRIQTLESQVANLNKITLCSAYVGAGGDKTYNGWIPFDTVRIDTQNCFNTSNGRFVVKEAGLYLVIFSFFSNSITPATTQRPSIGHYKSDGTQVSYNFVVSDVGVSISNIFSANVGDYFVAGTYNSSWSVAFFGSSGHNEFTIAKIG